MRAVAGDAFTVPVTVKLPPLDFDIVGQHQTVRLQPRITWHLYPAHVDYWLGGRTEIEGQELRVSSAGMSVVAEGVELPATYKPDAYECAWSSLGLQGTFTGAAALTAVARLAAAIEAAATTPKRHGRRGPGQSVIEQDVLLADALVRIARGASMRDAATETLEAYASLIADLPDRDAMVRRITRHRNRKQ